MRTFEQRKESAASTFAGHKLTVLSGPKDRCSLYLCCSYYEDGTENSHLKFFVSVCGDYLSIFGDVGTMTLKNRENMVAWLFNGLRTPEYLFSKIHNDNKDIREFSLQKFEEWLNEEIDLPPDDSYLDETDRAFFLQAANAGGDVVSQLTAMIAEKGDTAPYETADAWLDYTDRSWLRYFALRRFVQLHNKLILGK